MTSGSCGPLGTTGAGAGGAGAGVVTYCVTVCWTGAGAGAGVPARPRWRAAAGGVTGAAACVGAWTAMTGDCELSAGGLTTEPTITPKPRIAITATAAADGFSVAAERRGAGGGGGSGRGLGGDRHAEHRGDVRGHAAAALAAGEAVSLAGPTSGALHDWHAPIRLAALRGGVTTM